MGHLKRRGNAAKHEAGLEEGDIERLAVEGDQALEIPNAPDKGFQHGRFLGKVLHEKLLDHKTLSPEEAESHEKWVYSRAGGKPRAFDVEHGKVLDTEPLKRGVTIEGGGQNEIEEWEILRSAGKACASGVGGAVQGKNTAEEPGTFGTGFRGPGPGKRFGFREKV
jgi:hypothetical protein